MTSNIEHEERVYNRKPSDRSRVVKDQLGFDDGIWNTFLGTLDQAITEEFANRDIEE